MPASGLRRRLQCLGLRRGLERLGAVAHRRRSERSRRRRATCACDSETDPHRDGERLRPVVLVVHRSPFDQRASQLVRACGRLLRPPPTRSDERANRDRSRTDGFPERPALASRAGSTVRGQAVASRVVETAGVGRGLSRARIADAACRWALRRVPTGWRGHPERSSRGSNRVRSPAPRWPGGSNRAPGPASCLASGSNRFGARARAAEVVQSSQETGVGPPQRTREARRAARRGGSVSVKARCPSASRPGTTDGSPPPLFMACSVRRRPKRRGSR